MAMKDACPYCFKVLSVPARAKIYGLLLKRQRSVSDILKKFELSQPTISYHLKEMERAGLIESEKEGRQVFYSVSNNCFYGGGACILE